VQFFKALAKFFECEDKSHFLIVVAAVAISVSFQQVQAADPDFLMHAAVLFLKVVIASVHAATSVMFGCGRLLGWQLLLISSSHFNRVSVKFFSWAAPLFCCPLHVKLEAFPPPFSTILRTTGPKRPFFPDFPLPVLFCLVIREFCLS